MTRINTNVSSLTAQKTLASSNAQLQTALTRLSTGLRINSGKDDPAGLIASEVLRSDIISTEKAITNTQRANQMIATADSALGQVSTLLNDIRGLVTEAANQGVLSDDQIAANQLQIDSALEAINRIAQTTSFQGKKLLDGSLDFVSTAGQVSSIEDISIEQANLGAAGQIDVNVNIAAAATKATITSSSGEAAATAVLKFAPHALITFESATTDGVIDIRAAAPGPQMEGVRIVWSDVASATPAASYDRDSKTLTITYDSTDATAGVSDTIADAIDALDEFDAVKVTASEGALGAPAAGSPTTLTADTLTITAAEKGAAYNDVEVVVEGVNGLAAPTAQYYSDTKRLVIQIDTAASTTFADIETAVNDLAEFNAVSSDDAAEIYGNLSDAQARANTLGSGYLNSAFSAATNANATLSFAAGVKLASFADANTAFYVKAKSLDASFSDVTVSFVSDTTAVGSEYAEYDANAKTLKIHVNNAAATTADNVVNAINALDDWEATNASGATQVIAVADAGDTGVTKIDKLSIASLKSGANYNNMQIAIETEDGLGAANATASYDESANRLTIKVDSEAETDLDDIATAINSLSGFSAIMSTPGMGQVVGGSKDVTASGNTGNTGGNVLSDNLVVEIGGTDGAEVFNFESGASINDVVAAINLLADSTGVSATQNNGVMNITSTQYGSNALAFATVHTEGASGSFKSSLSSARANGTDIQATVNGVTANADGNQFSINTSSLDLSITLTAGSTANFEFSITGGGGLFQLGPDVVSSQQARLGIQSVNTASLRGKTGRLYELKSGESASLANNPTKAAAIVDEVLNKVTSLRGRLGAFQKTTLDTNMATLSDTLEALTDAQSSIRDADFAKETANLTRAQILVQSGTAVLGIANQTPQNVLSLLRG